MKLSVIIPCKNEAGTVDLLLESLTAQTRLADEVIVVDSHSSDETVAHANAFADRLPIRIVTATRKGVAHARNQGAARASGDMLLFIDADATFPSGLLAEFEKQIANKGYQVGGFTQRFDSPDRGVRIGGRLMNSYLRVMQYTPWPIAFSCLFATREAFDELKGFDPHLYIMEDYDLALRGKRAGYRVGVITSPFIASDRRFIDNPSQAWRGLYGELYRYTHGLRITKPIYRYDMGGKPKSDK